jgi:hypothetical protein
MTSHAEGAGRHRQRHLANGASERPPSGRQVCVRGSDDRDLLSTFVSGASPAPLKRGTCGERRGKETPRDDSCHLSTRGRRSPYPLRKHRFDVRPRLIGRNTSGHLRHPVGRGRSGGHRPAARGISNGGTDTRSYRAAFWAASIESGLREDPLLAQLPLECHVRVFQAKVWKNLAGRNG